ncbi:MAG: hypothetical protein R3D26_20825 [Cyanobacteriota/Melainabacteria group bacterium]
MKNSVTILFLVALAMVAFTSACLASSGKESDSSMKQEIKISFRLTKAGEPYDLKLLSGYDNPYAIKDALHALLYLNLTNYNRAIRIIPMSICTRQRIVIKS